MLRNLPRPVREFLLIAVAALVAAVTAERAAAVSIVVEFYNARYDHYFRTAHPAEVAALESNPAPDWVRTGKDFVVGGTTMPPTPLRGVCRFFAPVHTSHFYTVDPQECAYVRATWPHVWTYEGIVFEVVVPEREVCDPPARWPVYRLYNNRPDVNHRYVTNFHDYLAMQAQGWLPEGVVMCALDSSPEQVASVWLLGQLLGSWQFGDATATFSGIQASEFSYFALGEYHSESGERVPTSVRVGADGRFKAFVLVLRLTQNWYRETHDIDFAFAGNSDRVTGTDAFSISRFGAGTRTGTVEFTGMRLGP